MDDVDGWFSFSFAFGLFMGGSFRFSFGFCESLERNVDNGFDPQDEWRPNHELKSDQNDKREISHKRNHLTV
jgi:hypothetical protein